MSPCSYASRVMYIMYIYSEMGTQTEHQHYVKKVIKSFYGTTTVKYMLERYFLILLLQRVTMFRQTHPNGNRPVICITMKNLKIGEEFH